MVRSGLSEAEQPLGHSGGAVCARERRAMEGEAQTKPWAQFGSSVVVCECEVG